MEHTDGDDASAGVPPRQDDGDHAAESDRTPATVAAPDAGTGRRQAKRVAFASAPSPASPASPERRSSNPFAVSASKSPSRRPRDAFASLVAPSPDRSRGSKAVASPGRLARDSTVSREGRGARARSLADLA